MTEVAELIVNVVAKDQVSNVLTRLDAQLVRTDRSAQQSGRGIGQGIGAGSRQAKDSTLQLAQAQARLFSTTGQNSAAYQTLSSALAQTSTQGVSVIRAQTQLAQIQNRLSGQTQSLTSLFGDLSQQMSGLGGASGQAAGAFGNLAGSMGTIGALGAGLAIGKVAVDLSVAGANADLVRKRFDSLAQSAGTTGQALLFALRAASGGEISDLNLQLAANRAQLLGVADSAEEFSVLMGIARDRAQQMGISTTQAFNDLVTGLGRGSALILDNLGIVVSVTEANEQYAASLGKSVAQLSEAEKKQALINQVLSQGKASLDATGGAIESNAAKFAAFAATLENIKNQLGGLFATGLAPAAQGASDLLGILDGTRQGFIASAVAAQNFQRSLVGLPPVTGAEEAALRSMAAAQADLIGLTDGATASTAAATTAISAYQTSASVAAQEQQRLAEATRVAAEALNADAAESLLAAAKSEELGLAKQQLMAQAQAAAQALLASGAAGAATAARLAQSSSQVDVLTAAYYRLAAAQQAARVASITEGRAERTTAKDRADLNAVLAEQRAAQARGVAQHTNRLEAQGDAYKRIRDAQEAQIAATGTAAQKQALLTQQAERAATTYGRQSEQFIRAQTALQQFQQQQAKGGKGGGGAGGVKLSDQQKLNNALLTDQEKFNDKFEDAELDHTKRLLAIQRDFAEKALKAQRDFQSTNLDSRASFYDSLAGIEDAGLQKSLADQYEQAFAEAQQIAQTRGADIADEFLKSKQQQLQAQAQRASEIAEAEKANDKDKAAYLKGVDALYRQAEEDRLKRVLEGEDSIAAERDRQLAEEGLRYEEAQGKIANSADASADRRIAAALRAGKAVDAERLQVEGLALSYDKLGRAHTGAGITPTAGPAVTTTAPVPAEGGDPVIAALNAAQAAIVAALASVERAARDTASAVRSTRATGGIAG